MSDKRQKYEDAYAEYKEEFNEKQDDKSALITIDTSGSQMAYGVSGTYPSIMYAVSLFLWDLAEHENIPFSKVVDSIRMYELAHKAVEARHKGIVVGADDDTEVESIVLSGDNAEKARKLIEELKKLDSRENKCLN